MQYGCEGFLGSYEGEVGILSISAARVHLESPQFLAMVQLQAALRAEVILSKETFTETTSQKYGK